MTVRTVCIIGTAFVALACESRPAPAPSAIAELASAKPTLMGARPATVSPAKTEPARPIIKRPSSEADLLLSEEQRAEIEKSFPEAKGFLVARDLEQALFKQPLRRGKESGAINAFDVKAKGKWVLFTGNVMSPTREGFALPVRYTPRDPLDRVGLTSTWFGVQFREIAGYNAAEYEPGEMMVVLAKYNGQKAATSGHDLVLTNHWFSAKPSETASR